MATGKKPALPDKYQTIHTDFPRWNICGPARAGQSRETEETMEAEFYKAKLKEYKERTRQALENGKKDERVEEYCRLIGGYQKTLEIMVKDMEALEMKLENRD